MAISWARNGTVCSFALYCKTLQEVYPSLKLKVFVDDVAAFMEGRNWELPGIAGKVVRSISREVEEKDFRLSITEGGKEGKSKVIASCSDLEEKLQECTKREGGGLATSVAISGVDLRTRTKQLRGGQKEEVMGVLNCQKQSRLSEKPYDDWCEEVAEDGLWSCESVVRASSGQCACRKVEVEKADGGSSKQEGIGIGVALTFHGSA